MISLDVYIDSDFKSSLIDCKSTTRYCIFLAGNLVVWRSKKQEVVARSSTEAKFRALAHGLTEVMWIKGILQYLKIKMDCPTIAFLIINLLLELHIIMCNMIE